MHLAASKHQAGMAGQLRRLARLAATGQIGLARHRRQAALGQALHRHRGIGQIAVPDRQVDVFLDQVDMPLRCHEFHAHVGKALEERRQVRHHVKVAEQRRHRHPQQPRRLGAAAARLRLQAGQLVQHPQAALVEHAPRLGERKRARRAVQQLRAEPSLQPRHLLAGRRLADAGLLRGDREAAAFHHANEQPDGVEAVHMKS
nr:hypothetical protein [Burkholderia gladioli]